MKILIDTQKLIQEHGSEQKAISWLVSQIKSENIKFPYRRFFSEDSNIVFERLVKYQPRIHQSKYRLYAYYPKYKLFLPPLFRGNPILIVSTRNDYDTIDILSDLFIEDIRLIANRRGNLSPYVTWKDEIYCRQICEKAIKRPTITLPILREILYTIVPETKQFRTTWTKGILQMLIPQETRALILDMSAGWGDRLLTCMAMGYDYLGFDPNTELKPGYTLMIEKFGNPERHKVISLPFEDSQLPDNRFDVVLSSPPFYTLEEYSTDSNQSTVRYPGFMDWIIQFLFRSLEKAWVALKDEGFLVIHMGDTKQVHLAEPMISL